MPSSHLPDNINERLEHLQGFIKSGAEPFTLHHLDASTPITPPSIGVKLALDKHRDQLEWVDWHGHPFRNIKAFFGTALAVKLMEGELIMPTSVEQADLRRLEELLKDKDEEIEALKTEFDEAKRAVGVVEAAARARTFAMLFQD